MKPGSRTSLAQRIIENKIFLIRGKRVMLDRDLAELYGVQTKRLNEQVKRNHKRFPGDFAFQLTKNEMDSLRSQIATLKKGEHSKYKIYAFTEHGILMLSSVLNSDRAIQVNIQIMRAFNRIRQMVINCEDLKKKIETMEAKYDMQFRIVFEAIKRLIRPPEPPPTGKRF